MHVTHLCTNVFVYVLSVCARVACAYSFRVKNLKNCASSVANFCSAVTSTAPCVSFQISAVSVRPSIRIACNLSKEF